MTTGSVSAMGSNVGDTVGALTSRVGSWAVWLLPFAALALLLGWETDWGRRFAETPVPETPSAPTPVQVSLLPEFSITGGPEARRETVDRTLFNPTRRPAPPPPQEVSKPRLQRGQFVLTGTAVSGATTIAFLREANGGRSRTARTGDVVNGMTVAEVKPDRIRLTLGDESEDVVMKVAVGPKATTQPGPPAVPGQPGTPAGGAPQAAAPAATAPAPAAAAAGQPAEAQTLLERRRAARAAAAAGQPPADPALPPAVANPSVPAQAPIQATPQTDPRWAEIYQRMMQRGN